MPLPVPTALYDDAIQISGVVKSHKEDLATASMSSSFSWLQPCLEQGTQEQLRLHFSCWAKESASLSSINFGNKKSV